jgi:DNA-binding XRE family transcriptional regulator
MDILDPPSSSVAVGRTTSMYAHGPSGARLTPAAKRECVRLGKRLRALRIGLDMTQEKAAEASEVSPVTVSNVERGLANITISTMVSLAHAYRVRLRDLFD